MAMGEGDRKTGGHSSSRLARARSDEAESRVIAGRTGQPGFYAVTFDCPLDGWAVGIDWGSADRCVVVEWRDGRIERLDEFTLPKEAP